MDFSKLTIAQAFFRSLPPDMDELIPFHEIGSNVLIPKCLITTLTPAQKYVLKILSNEIADFNLIVTSTNVIYNGVPRTLNDGPSHVAKQAIDIVLNDPACPNTIISNNIYSRSLLWMAIMFRLWKKHSLFDKYAIGFEPSHFHIHLKSQLSESTFVLFENDTQIRGLMQANSKFLAQCQGHKPKDITQVLFYLFNN